MTSSQPIDAGIEEHFPDQQAPRGHVVPARARRRRSSGGLRAAECARTPDSPRRPARTRTGCAHVLPRRLVPVLQPAAAPPPTGPTGKRGAKSLAACNLGFSCRTARVPSSTRTGSPSRCSATSTALSPPHTASPSRSHQPTKRSSSRSATTFAKPTATTTARSGDLRDRRRRNDPSRACRPRLHQQDRGRRDPVRSTNDHYLEGGDDGYDRTDRPPDRESRKGR